MTRTPPLAPDDAEFFAAARLRAARLQPYLAAAVFSLIPVERAGLGTFAVDRWWRVYLDMATAREWGVEATAAVLLHEVHHVVRDHHGRSARLQVHPTQARRWNLAADAAINDDLIADGLPLPDPVLPSTLGLRAGRIEEAYFADLLEASARVERESCGSGAGGTPSPTEIDETPDRDAADGVDDVDASAIRRSVAHDVVRAHEQLTPVSPGLLRWAEELLDPQVPWQTVLRGVLGRTIRSVTSTERPDWSRADRRADTRPDFPRPGRRHHRPEVSVVLDTSASMSVELLDTAVTEIDALLHRAGVGELTVVVCDVDAVRPQRVRRVGQLELRGGGGTDLRVGIAAAAEQRPTPSIIVVLTDGWTPWPRTAPSGSSLVAVVIGDEAALPEGPGIQALRIAASGDGVSQ